MTVLYIAEATAIGDGRDGRVSTSDGLLDLVLAAPVEPGGHGGAPNPEQLFAAGHAACFHAALRMLARRAGTDITDSQVIARVGIGRAGSGGYRLSVALDVALPATPRDTAEELVIAAHQICPYSNATRGNIDVTLTVTRSTEGQNTPETITNPPAR